ncbi:MAG: hypothetical protein AMXMBFR25_25430 [Lysobacterales bacterium]
MRSRLLGCCILLVAAAPLLAADEDEIWIERYMSQPGASAQPGEIRRGYRIAWTDLRRFVGVPVKVSTDTGGVHRGRIEHADDQAILLRARLHGGYADLLLRREQVLNAELD